MDVFLFSIEMTHFCWHLSLWCVAICVLQLLVVEGLFFERHIELLYSKDIFSFKTFYNLHYGSFCCYQCDTIMYLF